MRIQLPLSGAVKVTLLPASGVSVRSVVGSTVYAVLGGAPAVVTLTAWTQRSFCCVTPAAGATTGAGAAPEYVPLTFWMPYASSLIAPGLSGVMLGTALGQDGPAVRSMLMPFALASCIAAVIASTQAWVPQPWPAGSSPELTLWWTSVISAPPNPAAAIWSISALISFVSTSAFGHHQRNLGCTARAG